MKFVHIVQNYLSIKISLVYILLRFVIDLL